MEGPTNYYCKFAIPNCWGGWITAPTETACEYTWDCPEKIYSVKCTADQDNWACDCVVHGVVQKSFTSTNFCNTASKNLKAAAEIGCGWTFPPEPTN